MLFLLLICLADVPTFCKRLHNDAVEITVLILFLVGLGAILALSIYFTIKHIKTIVARLKEPSKQLP
jgi:hypothetical protein